MFVLKVAGAEGVMSEMEPLTVNTETMEEQGDGGDDGSSQVVAQLVKAELPSPGMLYKLNRKNPAQII